MRVTSENEILLQEVQINSISYDLSDKNIIDSRECTLVFFKCQLRLRKNFQFREIWTYHLFVNFLASDGKT